MISNVTVELCKKGKFREALQLIEKVDLESVLCVRIIVGCCNACHDNLSSLSNLNDQHLICLLKTVVPQISVISSGKCDSYLQGTFHILNFLFKKENYRGVLALEELCLASFLSTLKDTQLIIGNKIGKLFYNGILQLSKKAVVDEDLVEDLTFLLVRFYKKIDDLRTLLSDCYYYLVIFLKLDVASQRKADFYHKIMKIIGKIEDITLFSSVMNNYNLMSSALIKDEKFELFRQSWSITADMFINCKDKSVIGLLEILKILEWLPPMDRKEIDLGGVHNQLKKYYRTYATNENYQAACNLILNVADAITRYHKSKKRNFDISIAEQMVFINFCLDLSQIFSQIPFKCSCKSCTIKLNINSSVNCLRIVVDFSENILLQQPKIAKNFKVIIECVDKYIEYLVVLKENNCSKWEKLWYWLGATLYGIGKEIKEIDAEMAILFLKKFINSLLKLEGFESKIIESHFLKYALINIAECYLENGDFEKSMLASVLHLIFFNDSKGATSLWIKAKGANRESLFKNNAMTQELTVVSIIDKMKDEVKSYTEEKLEFDSIKLLVYELRAYKAKWMSRIPVMAALRQLAKEKDVETSAEIFFEILGDHDVHVHESIPKVVYDLTNKLERVKALKKKYLLAYMYFLSYKYKMLDTIAKHCDDMEKTIAFEEDDTAAKSETNDKCDIFSSYEALSISRYVVATKDLLKSVQIIKKTDSKTRLKLFKLATMIGHEYHLHLQKNLALEIWFLVFGIAQLEQDDLHMLEAATFILDLSTPSDSIRELISSVEAKIENLVLKECFLQLSNYYASKAQAFLYFEVTEAYEAFKKANFFHKKLENNILQARLYKLQHHFNFLPCHYQIEGHQDKSLVSIHQAYEEACKFYNNNNYIVGGKSYEMRIFFEIRETLVKMYYNLRMPRELRCYGKDFVVFAQKMALPLRVFVFLYDLAYADLLCCRLDDCEVKVTGMDHILSLDSSFAKISAIDDLTVKEKKTTAKSSIKTDTIEVIIDDFDELTLGELIRSTNPASPILRCERFKMPIFINHTENCSCLYCTCSEYQIFAVKKTLIRAMLYEHRKNITVAEEFFRGAIELLKVLKISSCSVIYGTVILEYGNFLQRRNRISEAKMLNIEAISRIKRNGLELKEAYLYNELVFQCLNIREFEKLAGALQETQLDQAAGDKEDDCNELNVAMIAVTPSPPKHPRVVSPFAKPKRVATTKLKPMGLKFDFSDSEDEGNSRKAATSSQNWRTPIRTPTPQISAKAEGVENVRRSARNRSAKTKANSDVKPEKIKVAVKKYTSSRI